MERKIRILIVEDEALIAENLKLTLEDLGYEVSGCCYNYEEAIDAIHRNDADLVMLDINLGSRLEAHNGLAIAVMLHIDFQRPFIFLTAYSDTDTIRRATKLQPSGYLIKPVNAAAIFAAIQTAIERADKKQGAPPPNLVSEQPDFFFVKVGTKNHKLFWEDVHCIEAGKNYVKLRLAHSATEYPIRGTLTFVLEQLLPQRLQHNFVRVSRSVSLNKKFITSYSNEWIYCGKERFENTRITVKELAALIEQ